MPNTTNKLREYEETDTKIKRPLTVTLGAILVGIFGVRETLAFILVLHWPRTNLDALILLATIVLIFYHGIVSYGLFKLSHETGYKGGLVLSGLFMTLYILESIKHPPDIDKLSLAIGLLYASILACILINGDVFEELKDRSESEQ